MRIYENAWPTTYEEIKTWYPVWYREVFEMDAIWRVIGLQMDNIQATLIWMVDNNFIDFADAFTITRLENFLGIVHPFPRTLVERRAILRGFTLGRGHIGRRQIKEMISLFTTGEIDVGFIRPGRINVTVTRDFGDMFNLADIYMVIGHRIPAHLSLGIIDSPRPVRVVNQNNFNFINLLMVSFRIANITSPRIRLNGERILDGTWLLGAGSVHGINFVDFHVKAVIRNHGVISEGITLDGSNILDGSFFLNGRKFGVLRGMAPHSLRMGAFKITNKFRITSGFGSPKIQLKNKVNFQLSDLSVKGRLSIKAVNSLQRFTIGSYRLHNTNRIGSGTLAKVSGWNLDGQLNLDAGLSAGGTQNLGTLTIKEDL